jgi:hypothetical protein
MREVQSARRLGRRAAVALDRCRTAIADGEEGVERETERALTIYV